MDYHVLEARYVGGHVVWVRFRDGTTGEIDLAPALNGPRLRAASGPAVLPEILGSSGVPHARLAERGRRRA